MTVFVTSTIFSRLFYWARPEGQHNRTFRRRYTFILSLLFRRYVCVFHQEWRSTNFELCEFSSWEQGRNEGVQGWHNSPCAEALWGRRMTAEEPKSPNNVTSTFFNTVHLLPKDLRSEYGGAKLVSRPGRDLTSLRRWVWHFCVLRKRQPVIIRSAKCLFHIEMKPNIAWRESSRIEKMLTKEVPVGFVRV